MIGSRSLGQVADPDERGFALIEVLVAMVVIAVLLSALMLFTTGLLRAGAQQSSVSAARNRAVTAVEDLDAMKYKACSAGQTTAQFETSFGSSDEDYWSVTGDLGDGYDVSITGVRFLASSAPNVDTANFVDTCPSQDQGAQQITVKVTKIGTSHSANLTLAKRDASCSTAVLAGVPNPVPEGENGIGEC